MDVFYIDRNVISYESNNILHKLEEAYINHIYDYNDEPLGFIIGTKSYFQLKAEYMQFINSGMSYSPSVPGDPMKYRGLTIEIVDIPDFVGLKLDYDTAIRYEHINLLKEKRND